MKFLKLHKDAVLPERATPGSAGYDLSILNPSTMRIEPQGTLVMRTGVGTIIPQNHVGLITIRSSLARDLGLSILNSPGIIDSDYRGEIMILLHNASAAPAIIYGHSRRIAQLIVTPFLASESQFQEDPAEASATVRGTGGFGSTSLGNKHPVEPLSLPEARDIVEAQRETLAIKDSVTAKFTKPKDK